MASLTEARLGLQGQASGARVCMYLRRPSWRFLRWPGASPRRLRRN